MKSSFAEYTLGEVVSTVIDRRGVTPKKLGGDWSDHGFRAISAKNIKKGRLIEEGHIRFVSAEMYKRWMPVEVSKNDILITSEAPFGETLLWDSDEKIVASQRVFVLKIKPGFNPNYIFYYMSTSSFKAELEARSSGTTVTGLRQPELLKCKVFCPNYETQIRIGLLLRSIDKKIDLNNRINVCLFEQAQALFQEWFIDFKPFSDNGSLPAGWKQCTVGDIVEIHDSKRIPLSSDQRLTMEKKYPYYGAASLMDYVDDYLFDGVYLLLGEDGTVITDSGFPVLQYVEGQFWVNNHAHILTGKNGYSVEELYLFFSQTTIASIVTGAVQPKVSQANLKKLQAILPPQDVLEEFSAIIDPFFSQYRANKKENDRLSFLRDSLLPKLMSGEIDVDSIKID